MHINRVICTSRTHPIFCGSKAFSNYQKPSSGVLSNCFLFSKRFQFSGIVREFVWGGFFTIQFVQYLINLGQFIFREVVAVIWAALGRIAILTIE